MRCAYCPQHTHVAAYRLRSDQMVMDFHDYLRCLDKLPTSVDVMFAGMAEPWLNQYATEMVIAAHKRGHTVQVYTTLYGMCMGDVERLADVPFDLFCIHLPDADGQMNLRPSIYYVRVLEAAMKLPNVKLMCIGKLHPEVREALGRDVDDGAGALVSRAGNLPGKAIPRKTGPLRCSACAGDHDHLVLLSNGDVVLCCMDYGLRHVLGNLLVCEYANLFSGEEYRSVLAAMNSENGDVLCRHCECAVNK